jgi:hypothetical protein
VFIYPIINCLLIVVFLFAFLLSIIDTKHRVARQHLGLVDQMTFSDEVMTILHQMNEFHYLIDIIPLIGSYIWNGQRLLLTYKDKSQLLCNGNDYDPYAPTACFVIVVALSLPSTKSICTSMTHKFRTSHNNNNNNDGNKNNKRRTRSEEYRM